MSKKRVMYVTSAIKPYLECKPISEDTFSLAKFIQNSGDEIRIFMPRFGVINERKYQLHEVLRLSGMNIILNDLDKYLIVKVSSIPRERMQVYFIDNEDYFYDKKILLDSDNTPFKLSDEKMIFFARGVLETVKKANWSPDIIHISGWISYLLPLYISTNYRNITLFENTKTVLSLYDDDFDGMLDDKLIYKLKFDQINDEKINILSEPNYENLLRIALQNSDAIVQYTNKFESIVKEFNKPLLNNPSQKELAELYNTI